MRKKRIWPLLLTAVCLAAIGGSTVQAKALVSESDLPDRRVPVITVQPHDVSVNLGDMAYFYVEAQGEDLRYQWYTKKINARAWTKWRNHTESATSAPANPTWNNMQVFCLVTDGGGAAVSSAPALISVKDELMIVGQPEDFVMGSAQAASFSVKTYGGGLTYQWYYRGGEDTAWTRLVDEQEPELMLPAAWTHSGARVYCAVRGSGKCVLTREAEIISPDDVLQQVSIFSMMRGRESQPSDSSVKIVSHPAHVTVSEGETAAFLVKAKGSALCYQWYYQKAGQPLWTRWLGHTDTSVETVADAGCHGMRVCCEITDGAGHSVRSEPAAVTVDNRLAISNQPQNVTLPSGNVPALGVKARGSGLRYQWYRQKRDADGFERWDGQSAAQITARTETSWHKMQVYCEVTDGSGLSLNSETARIWVTDALDILSQPRDVSVSPGETVTFSVRAQGRGLRYQWYYRKAGARYWHIWKHHTTSTTEAMANDTWDGMRVYCRITDSRGNTVYSRAALVTTEK